MHTGTALQSRLANFFAEVSGSSKQIYWARSADFQEFNFISPTVEGILGISSKRLKHDPTLWVQSIVKNDRDRVRQTFLEWQLKAVNEQVLTVEYHMQIVSKGVVKFVDQCIPVFEQERLVAFFGVTKQLDQKLSDDVPSNLCEYFRYFAEKSGQVYWLSQSDDITQIYISPAFEKVWQHSVNDSICHSTVWIESILSEDKESYLACLSDLESGKIDSFKCRYRIKRPDGQVRFISDRSFVLKGEQGQRVAFGGIAEDITEDAVRQQGLRSAKEQAEKSNEAKSDFLALMSHELRTPLNAIFGMAQILYSSNLTSTQSDQIDVIMESGKNLLNLLNDILDINKLEVGKLTFKSEDIEVNRFATHLIDEMLPLVSSKPIKLSYHIDTDVPRFIVGDSKRLFQVLANLLTNAIKYTKQGYVKLSISCLQQNHKEAALCFTVEDSGIGIEKSQLNSIFGKYLQIESVHQRKHEGVGLGLAIVKELVEGMGGSVAVSSEPDVGSQFSCILLFGLQYKEETKISGRSIMRMVSEPNVKYNNENYNFGLNVLIVEDNKINQKISKILLAQMGCKSVIAENAKAAIASDFQKYDLILMDIGLPDMDGFALTRCIREKESNNTYVPIVAMTAHVFEQDREECFKAGMNDVIQKPLIRDHLISVLQRWV